MKKYKIAVYPLHNDNSAFFALTRNSMKVPSVELVDFRPIARCFWKYDGIDAVFLSFYESVKSRGPLKHVKRVVKALLKVASIYFLKFKKIRIIYYIHNKEDHDAAEKKLVGRLSNLLIRKADRIVMLCKDTENYLLEKRNGEELVKKAVYIPHPEYSSVYTPDKSLNFRKSLGIDDNAFVVLLFGMIRPYKNIEIWLEAAKRLRDKNMTFLLAGDGKDRDYVEGIAELCAKEDNVIFIERFIEDREVASLYKAADVLTLPYDKGSLNSGAVMAALTFGVPVICPDMGTIHDYSDEFFTVYDYNSAGEHIDNLARSILRCYESINAMTAEEKAAFQDRMIHEVRENASVQVLHDKYISLYSDLFSADEAEFEV